MAKPYLIFDFDGVLGDTWDVLIKGLVHNGEYNTHDDAVSAMNHYFSTKPNHTRVHALTEEELEIKRNERIKNGHYLNEVGFGLFGDFVDEVEQIPTPFKAIVSSGTQGYIIPAIAKTAINPTHVLAFEDHHSKEEKIEHICRDWDVDLEEVFYFTDSLADVYELENFIAQSKLIGVSWGFCTKTQLLTKLPEDQILDEPEDIHVILDK